jgi:hypothetical protein
MKRWFNWPEDNRHEHTVGAILSVTMISVTVAWVGVLALLVGKFVF